MTEGRGVRGTLWRATAVVGLVLSPLPAGTAAAGPLDPPSSRLTVRLIEPTSRTSPPLTMVLGVTQTDDTGAIVSVGFRRNRDGKRTVLDAGKSFYLEARRGGFWPVLTRDGQSQVPPCPAAVLCSSPNIGEETEVTYRPTTPGLSYYLFVRDVPALRLSVSAGWRVREVSGGDLLTYRDSGTSARVSANNRQYAVQDFRGVASPRVGQPSVAFASIPCWPPPLPGGNGAAVLTNGGKGASLWRQMECATYRSGASGGSDTATTWRNDGASFGWSGGMVMRLVVAVLPPGW